MKTQSFRLFGKNVVSTFHHHIMSLVFESVTSSQSNLRMLCVTSQPDKIVEGPYSIKTAKRLLIANQDKCDVFIVLDDENNKVGTISVMYRGGNDIEYRIRNIDAFIYNVFTNEEYRGRGYAGDMIKMLMAYLHECGIDKAYLAVSTNNSAAVRAYEKVGFITEKDLSFVRIMRVNIPYWKL